MKIFSGLAIFYNSDLVSGGKPRNCDLTELPLPANAEIWDCSGVTGNLVPVGNTCKLKCDVGYEAVNCKIYF